MPTKPPRPSINGLTAPLVAALVRDACALRLTVQQDQSGVTLIDAGIEAQGGIEAGRRVAEICLGGLGHVSVTAGGTNTWPWQISVHTANPVLACLGSQYAGWSLKHEDPNFFALGSGPGRSLAVKEEIFTELDYRDRCTDTVLVLEVDRSPPSALLRRVAEDCSVAANHLTVIMTPTQSLAGAVQIAARSLEVALHKAHTLKFPLDRIVDGLGIAALPPPTPNFVAAMGRTNDAILYGGTVELFVTGPDDAARQLADQLPSGASRDYGRPFAETFAAYKGDFYQIDPLLFSPGVASVTALESGRTFCRGRLDPELLAHSFALSRD